MQSEIASAYIYELTYVDNRSGCTIQQTKLYVRNLLGGCLDFHNPITLDTEFVMMFLNCFHRRRFNQTVTLVNLRIIHYI
jgi:hypothetical protein